MEHVVVFTGAGMSAESGLHTFRDSGGLWEGYDVMEVASIEGWYKNPKKVLDFYNLRRQQAWNAQPNGGHIALAKLEKACDVTIITQNVDNLHEKAGSHNIIHLHGSLFRSKSDKNDNLIYDTGLKDINIGDFGEDGGQLRPDIVWFGEMVPMMELAIEKVVKAEHFIVIGTSLVVYPAASLLHYLDSHVPVYIIDPQKPDIYLKDNYRYISKTAAEGTPELVDDFLKRQL